MHRFDFAGNGASGGEFRYTGYDAEVSDLRAVVEVRVLSIGCNYVMYNFSCTYIHIHIPPPPPPI